MTPDHTQVLIIGAGPFGLSLAAYADHLGIEHRVHGVPMGFWRDNMPKGMFLRSACDWHLDATGDDTIAAYVDSLGLTPAEVEPLSLGFYLDYAAWFQQRRALEPDRRLVVALDQTDHGFAALLDDGSTVTADNVVVALGFRHFPNVPDDLLTVLPRGSFAHTCDLVDLAPLAGRRCLIVGGRQSAFEWAALLHEAGAAAVHLSHRHPSPSFAEADWTWVNPLVDAMVSNPGWFRRLSSEQKEDVTRRLWAEGRLKVEPWLETRVRQDGVRIHPDSRLVACETPPGGALRVRLDNGSTFDVDEIVLATGYKPELARVPFLVAGNVLGRLESRNGLPALDERFQTSLPGLFMTSMLAVQDFGPFFAFTVSVRTSARLIGDALLQRTRPLAGAG